MFLVHAAKARMTESGREGAGRGARRGQSLESTEEVCNTFAAEKVTGVVVGASKERVVVVEAAE